MPDVQASLLGGGQSLEVPVPNIDYNKSQAQAYSLADASFKNAEQKEEFNDKQVVQDWLKQGNELITPEGVLKGAEELKGKVSAKGYQNLIHLRDKRSEIEAKIFEQNAKKPEQVLHQEIARDSLLAKSGQAALDKYDQVLKENEALGSQQAAIEAEKAYQAVLAAQVPSLVAQGAIPKERAQQASAMPSAQMRGFIPQTNYGIAQRQAALKQRLEAANARKSEATASVLEKGGKEMAEYAYAVETYGEESPQAKAALQHLQGSKGAQGGMGKPEMKTVSIDGVPTVVNYGADGKIYTQEGEVVESSRVKPLEKSGLSPVQLATVDKDLFETKKFLEKARNMKTGQTASLFFGDDKNPGAIKRWAEKKLSTEEQQLYDVYANRMASALVGMQSVGRYRGSNLSLEEAKKLLPVPGDTNKTVKAKLDYIEEFAQDTDEEMTMLKHGRKLKMPPKEGAKAAPKESTDKRVILEQELASEQALLESDKSPDGLKLHQRNIALIQEQLGGQAKPASTNASATPPKAATASSSSPGSALKVGDKKTFGGKPAEFVGVSEEYPSGWKYVNAG